MVNPLWSWGLTCVGAVGIYLAGKKSKWGWAVGIGVQPLWAIYATVTEQYGFYLSVVIYGGVYIKNFLAWRNSSTS